VHYKVTQTCSLREGSCIVSRVPSSNTSLSTGLPMDIPVDIGCFVICRRGSGLYRESFLRGDREASSYVDGDRAPSENHPLLEATEACFWLAWPIFVVLHIGFQTMETFQ
jgi:hypothetical protein